MKGYTRKNADEAKIEVLREIAKKHSGMLHPQDVVTHARNPKSPLHSVFDWDDSSAANAYRLEQARRFISATIEYIDVGGEQKEVQVFCSLSTDATTGGGYREIKAVMAKKEFRDQMLADALAEMKVFVEKYKTIRQLAKVTGVMKRFLKTAA